MPCGNGRWNALRTPSTGVGEVDETRGLVKYAKPAGVIASLIPMTNPAMTPPVTGVSAANARNAVIFSPHPRTAQTTFEMVEAMRAACEAVGAPKDLFQSIRYPSIPITQHPSTQRFMKNLIMSLTHPHRFLKLWSTNLLAMSEHWDSMEKRVVSSSGKTSV